MAKNSISEYKDRMTSPMGIVRTNPKTGKPVKKRAAVKRKAK